MEYTVGRIKIIEKLANAKCMFGPIYEEEIMNKQIIALEDLKEEVIVQINILKEKIENGEKREGN